MRVAAGIALALGLAGAACAQGPVTAPPPSVTDVQAGVRSLRKEVKRQSRLSAETRGAVQRLQGELAAAQARELASGQKLERERQERRNLERALCATAGMALLLALLALAVSARAVRRRAEGTLLDPETAFPALVRSADERLRALSGEAPERK